MMWRVTAFSVFMALLVISASAQTQVDFTIDGKPVYGSFACKWVPEDLDQALNARTLKGWAGSLAYRVMKGTQARSQEEGA